MPLVCYPELTEGIVLPIRVVGVGLCCRSVLVLPKEHADIRTRYPQLLMTVYGRAEAEIGGRSMTLSGGSVLYCGAGADCRISGMTSDWDADWVSFTCSEPGALFLPSDAKLFLPRDPEAVSASFAAIYADAALDVHYGGVAASAKLYTLLTELNREAEAIPEEQIREHPAIRTVIGYIDSHYTEDISLAQLCSAAGGMSEQYLCRLFKRVTGLRPIEYVLRKRISVARAYLEQTDLPIPDVAERTGFHNTSYFYRNFKKFTGTSPLACRQNAADAKIPVDNGKVPCYNTHEQNETR